jgi:hypothetical protein
VPNTNQTKNIIKQNIQKPHKKKHPSNETSPKSARHRTVTPDVGERGRRPHDGETRRIGRRRCARRHRRLYRRIYATTTTMMMTTTTTT